MGLSVALIHTILSFCALTSFNCSSVCLHNGPCLSVNKSKNCKSLSMRSTSSTKQEVTQHEA